MSAKLKLKHPALISAVLLLAVAAVYLPAGFLDFTNYDDPYYVTENPPVLAGLTWAGFFGAFTDLHTGNWHPLTFLSHSLDCQFFGLAPAGHHVTSVIFHAANTVLLFLLLRSMTGTTWRSAMVAALFGLHPLHVESVAWVSERKDVLSTFFGLLSLLAYAACARKSRMDAAKAGAQPANGAIGSAEASSSRAAYFTPGYLLAFMLFALGLMSKPMLVTWPCVMLLLDIWPLRRWEPGRGAEASTLWRLVGEKIPFFALAAASCAITFHAQSAGMAVAPLDAVPLASRVMNAVIGYFSYLVKLVWPFKLAVIYPYVQAWPLAEVSMAAGALIAVTVTAVWQRERRPYLPVGWAWYLGTLVPVIGLVQVGNQAMADRYSYIPAIGVFLMFVWGMAEWVGEPPVRRALAAAAAAVLLVVCALTTQAQLAHWQTSETLFTHALAVTRGNYIAYNSLGFYYADQRQVREAERCFRAALAINPRSEWALNKLGSLLVDQGRYAEAVGLCEAALNANPRMAEAHGTLGLALMKQSRTNEALAHYAEALRLQPQNATIHYNLANALAQQNQFSEAREHYAEAVRLDPRSADAHNNLAFLLVRAGMLDAAVAEFQAAVACKPGLWPAHYGLAEVWLRQGRPAEAAVEFAEVLKLNPGFERARLQLAAALARQGNGQTVEHKDSR